MSRVSGGNRRIFAIIILLSRSFYSTWMGYRKGVGLQRVGESAREESFTSNLRVRRRYALKKIRQQGYPSKIDFEFGQNQSDMRLEADWSL